MLKGNRNSNDFIYFFGRSNACLKEIGIQMTFLDGKCLQWSSNGSPCTLLPRIRMVVWRKKQSEECLMAAFLTHWKNIIHLAKYVY